MQTSGLANWLQIIGNFGIFAGLILVGYEIRQSGEIAHAQIVSDGYAQTSELILSLAGEEPGEAWAKSLSAPDQLTDEEIVKLDAFLSAYWYQRVRSEYLAEFGFASQTPEVYGEAAAVEYFDTPFGLAWWQEISDGFGTWAPGTNRAIAATLKDVSNHHLGETARIERIRARLAELSIDDEANTPE